MRLSKFLFLTSFVTLIALTYVYQQNEIFYFAYLGSKKQAMLTDLLDKNNFFRYNIDRFSSLPYLDNKILRNVDFEIPATKQLVRLQTTQDNIEIAQGAKKRPNVFFSFFSRARQAQAQPLNR